MSWWQWALMIMGGVTGAFLVALLVAWIYGIIFIVWFKNIMNGGK